jgi:amino-acid N-acetyltransferase
MGPIDIRPGPPLAAAVALLGRSGLPFSDLTEPRLENFLFCGPPDAPTGLIGLEMYHPDALLRSLAVAPAARRAGMGSALLEYAERHARANDIETLYLLTTTARSFFEGRGYRVAAREACPMAIQTTAEFSILCPTTSTLLMKGL